MQGGPSWIDSERFDVVAKPDPDDGEVKSEQWSQMVQVLLEDRLKLKFHTETGEMQVLTLVLEKAAPKLDEPKAGEETAFIPGQGGQMTFQKMPIVGLVNTMSNILHAPVVTALVSLAFLISRSIRGRWHYKTERMVRPKKRASAT